MEKSETKRIYYKQDVEITDGNKGNIGVAATWFGVNHLDRTLKIFPLEQHNHVSLKYYHLTIPPPIIIDGKSNVLEELTFLEICSDDSVFRVKQM